MTRESRERVREGYSKDGEQYDSTRLEGPRGTLISAHDVALFERLLPAEPGGMRLREVGAGTGRFTLPALARGFTVVATDVNEAMLARLRPKVELRADPDRCQVRREDIFNLSFPDDSFDFVFCFHVIPRFLNLDDQRAALIELARVVRPGGRLLFNYRNSWSPYNLVYKRHAASPRKIESILGESGIQVVKKRGKLLLNRTLLNALPVSIGRVLSGIDRITESWLPDLAWDVFVLGSKGPESADT